MIFLDEQDKKKINEIPQDKDKSVVLVGVLGRGKTTLYNKMTNSNQMATRGLQSNTHRAFMKKSSYGNGFKVLDTPGFNSRSDKIQHTAGLLAALSEGPLNRIILVMIYSRLDIIIKEFLEIRSTFRRFFPLITIALTHWDMRLKNVNEDQERQNIQQEELKQIISKEFEKFGIKSVMFIAIDTTGEEICHEVDRILENSPPENVILSESEILLNFDFWPEDEEKIYKFEEHADKLELKFEKFRKTINKFIVGYPTTQNELIENVQEKDLQSFTINLMNQLTEFAKNYAEQIVEEFQKENKQAIDDLCEGNDQLAYLIYFDLKKRLFKGLENIQTTAQKKLLIYQNHCYNYLRKCVKCGLVWLKVAGCTSYTACGGIPTKDELIDFEKPPVQFNIKYENDNLVAKVNQNYKSEKEKFQGLTIAPLPKKVAGPRQQVQVEKEVFEIGEYGCGYIQQWCDMDLLSPQEYQELYNNSLMEYFKQYETQKEKSISVKSEIFREKLTKEVQLQRQTMKQSS